MNYLGNAFSLNMVQCPCIITAQAVTEVPPDAVSCIGHESTAQVVSALLGRPVSASRQAVSLADGDSLYLLAIFGPDGKPFRPPEGAVLGAEALVTLRLEWRKVLVVDPRRLAGLLEQGGYSGLPAEMW